MRTFLLWSPSSSKPAGEVASGLSSMLHPVLAAPPKIRVLESDDASLVFLEQPVRGWKGPFFEENGNSWAIAPDYPFGGKADSLLSICNRLDEDPTSSLDQLAPPFALIWSEGRGGIRVQNDGLGLAQLFEYNDGRLWALTNRVSALSALGIRLIPEPEEWAIRVTLGWFPLNMSGYRNVRFVGPGTEFVLGRHGVRRKTYDTLRRWISSDPLAENECLELARWSLIEMIEAAVPLWNKPWATLSGGHDTRAVVSSLLVVDADFSVKVNGSLDHPDVVLAQDLAQRAGLRLKVLTESGLPPEDPEGCRRCISLALLWQAGYRDAVLHKSFLARHKGFQGGGVNVMGQHGEIGRGYYARSIGAREQDADYDDALLQRYLAKTPRFLRPNLREGVQDTIHAACRQADDYGLRGSRRLDFFYLYERTRRWASGQVSSLDGLVFAPMSNPGYIRAVFAFPGSVEGNPFHDHIVARHMPEWVDVPYTSQLPRSKSSGVDWRHPVENHPYDSALYWKTVGTSLIEEALSEGGWWTEVFDPTLARTAWNAAPDELAIAYLLMHVLDGLADGAGSPRSAGSKVHDLSESDGFGA